MVKQKRSRSVGGPAFDKSKVRNEILLGLPQKERAMVLSKAEYVVLPLRRTMHEAGEAIKFGFFVNSGMASVLTVTADGKSVEVGLVGKEGLVGADLAAGFRTSMTLVVVQAPLEGFRVPAAAFAPILERCPALRAELQRYTQNVSMQIAQVAACNRLHEVDERLARWLLMTHDRLQSARLPLTDEFLAQMLGTRRASVTVAAGLLQRAGFIKRERGQVEVLDRRGLEESSCECYEMIRQQLERRRKETKSMTVR
jgi:CRP-like cAMP-binding protein